MRLQTGVEPCRFAIARWGVVAACVLGMGASAQQLSEAILGYTDNVSALVGSTVGWTFQSTKVLTVTELGCFAKVFDDNPALDVIQVGLWDDAGSLLVSNLVTRESQLLGPSRYAFAPAVTLSSNQTYHVGVYYSGGRIGIDVAGNIAEGSITTSSEIQLRSAAVGSGGFVFPQEVPETVGSIYAGPNFLFATRPVLTISPLGTNQVRISWPTAYPGFTLQAETGLAGTWAGAGLPVNIVGTEYVAVDTIGPGPRFYRLAK